MRRTDQEMCDAIKRIDVNDYHPTRLLSILSLEQKIMMNAELNKSGIRFIEAFFREVYPDWNIAEIHYARCVLIHGEQFGRQLLDHAEKWYGDTDLPIVVGD